MLVVRGVVAGGNVPVVAARKARYQFLCVFFPGDDFHTSSVAMMLCLYHKIFKNSLASLSQTTDCLRTNRRQYPSSKPQIALRVKP
jgi:hypothetical protein